MIKKTILLLSLLGSFFSYAGGPTPVINLQLENNANAKGYTITNLANSVIPSAAATVGQLNGVQTNLQTQIDNIVIGSGGVTSNQVEAIAGSIISTSIIARATTVTGTQSNKIDTALQPSDTNGLWIAVTNLNTGTANNTTNYVNGIAVGLTNRIVSSTNSLWVSATNLITSTAINTTNAMVSSTNLLWVSVTNLNSSTANNTTNYINSVANSTTSYVNSVANGITNYVNGVAVGLTNRIVTSTNGLWIAVTNLNTATANNTTNYVNGVAVGLTNSIVSSTNSLWISVTNLNTANANSITSYINSVANGLTNRVVDATNGLWIAVTNLNTVTANNTTNYVNAVASGLTNRVVEATNSLWVAVTNLNTTTANNTTNYVNSVALNTTNTIVNSSNTLWVAVTNLNTATANNTTNYMNSVASGLTNRIVEATNSLWFAVTNLNTSTANNTTNYVNSVAVGLTNSMVSSTNNLWIAMTNLNTGTANSITSYVNSAANGITNRIVDATNSLWVASTNLVNGYVPTNRTITVNGQSGTLSSNLNFSVVGTSTSEVQAIIREVNSTGTILRATTVIGSQSNIISYAVTNNGIVVNGIPLGNGTNITITSGSANALTNNGATINGQGISNGVVISVMATNGSAIGLTNFPVNLVQTNDLVSSTNLLWIATTNLNTTSTNSLWSSVTNLITLATNDLWIATTNLSTSKVNANPTGILNAGGLTGATLVAASTLSIVNGNLQIPTNSWGGGTGVIGANGTNAMVYVTNTVTLAPGAAAWVSNNVMGTSNNLTVGIPGSTTTNSFILAVGTGLTNVVTGTGINTTNTISIADMPFQPWSTTLTNPVSGGTNTILYSHGTLVYVAPTGTQSIAFQPIASGGWTTNGGINRVRVVIGPSAFTTGIESNAAVVWANAMNINTAKFSSFIVNIIRTNVVLTFLTPQ